MREVKSLVIVGVDLHITGFQNVHCTPFPSRSYVWPTGARERGVLVNVKRRTGKCTAVHRKTNLCFSLNGNTVKMAEICDIAPTINVTRTQYIDQLHKRVLTHVDLHPSTELRSSTFAQGLDYNHNLGNSAQSPANKLSSVSHTVQQGITDEIWISIFLGLAILRAFLIIVPVCIVSQRVSAVEGASCIPLGYEDVAYITGWNRGCKDGKGRQRSNENSKERGSHDWYMERMYVSEMDRGWRMWDNSAQVGHCFICPKWRWLFSETSILARVGSTEMDLARMSRSQLLASWSDVYCKQHRNYTKPRSCGGSFVQT